MKGICLLLILFLFTISTGASQDTGSFQKRIYSYPMDPRQHPDDNRRAVKPPDSKVFNNRIQFMALRSLDGDYRKLLDQYTIKYGLGNIIWPSYPVLFRDDLPEVVREIKQRDLYLFDIWGFVPGSGPGGYWQQFVVPDNTIGLFEKELGDHWLGMDNGEQDGRYVGGYASQMYPTGDSMEQQYLNFQNHFQGLTDRLGNKMATLVSLNFGHYFLKENIYTLIGAETAQGLPNTQIYYSFIRGAGKQYGVPWFGNASVWNRWGWKNYSGITDYNGGDTRGTSLSLLKRLIYSHIMYNCVAAGFESSFLDSKDKLSPIGKIQQSANKWVEENGNPGILYTPVALMLDFYSGWSFPRHLYTEDIFKVWGNLPYEAGDFMTDGILDILYPGYQDASYFHDETGFITPTPYGDAADCLLTDCPLWLMKQYPVIIVSGKLKGGQEIKDKFENYVTEGGRLIITSGNLENMPGGLLGVKPGSSGFKISGEMPVVVGKTGLKEISSFFAKELSYPPAAGVIATSDNHVLGVELPAGKGTLIVLASPFGLSSDPLPFDKPATDKYMETPYPLLSHVSMIISNVLNTTRLFYAGEELSLITCRKKQGDYTIAVCNNSWQERPFQIRSLAGKVIKINELPLDCSERRAVGFKPESVTADPGKNTGTTIAGGDIRIFNVKIMEDRIAEIPFIQPVPNPVKRGLTLRKTLSLKEEILLRPTFFQNFDRVAIDWKYLSVREKSVLGEESGWLKRQGLKIIVDLTSGINLFPDLRLVNNDSLEYEKSMGLVKEILEKMFLLGAHDLILSTHRTIENNFTDESFEASLKATLQLICQAASVRDINVHLRLVTGKFASSLEQARKLQESVGEKNLYVAPSLALLAGDTENLDRNIGILKDLKYSILFISAPEKDANGKLWNLNLPLHKYGNTESLSPVLQAARDKVLLLDGIYDNNDEEYLDIKKLEECLFQILF